MEEMEACFLPHAQIGYSNPDCGNDFEINSPTRPTAQMRFETLASNYPTQKNIAILLGQDLGRLNIIAHRRRFAFDLVDPVFDQIANRDKADKLAVLDHRQMANPSLGHQ